jgi:hypothetical protein
MRVDRFNPQPERGIRASARLTRAREPPAFKRYERLKWLMI